MDILEAITKRYSCRSYKPIPIEPDKLTSLLEAARLAPSASNRQDWRFVVVTNPDTRAALAEAANNQMFLASAPVIIVACSINNHVMPCGQAAGPIDVSIALEHIALQATSLGLTTCWIGAFSSEKVKAILDISKDVSIIDLMPVGYPADKQPPISVIHQER